MIEMNDIDYNVIVVKGNDFNNHFNDNFNFYFKSISLEHMVYFKEDKNEDLEVIRHMNRVNCIVHPSIYDVDVPHMVIQVYCVLVLIVLYKKDSFYCIYNIDIRNGLLYCIRKI